MEASGRIVQLGCMMGAGNDGMLVAHAAGRPVYAAAGMFAAGNSDTAVTYVREIEAWLTPAPLRTFGPLQPPPKPAAAPRWAAAGVQAPRYRPRRWRSKQAGSRPRPVAASSRPSRSRRAPCACTRAASHATSGSSRPSARAGTISGRSATAAWKSCAAAIAPSV